MSLPDFQAKLDKELSAHDTHVAHWKSIHQKQIDELEAKGQTDMARKAKSDLNKMEYQWINQRENLLHSWKVWKDSILMREADKDFLRGVGHRANAAEESFLQMQARHPSFQRPVVGYVEIHQWHNEGPRQVQNNYTTFQDLLDENRAMNWWTRKTDILKASLGHYLYAIQLGGVLKLVSFNPDTKD